MDQYALGIDSENEFIQWLEAVPRRIEHLEEIIGDEIALDRSISSLMALRSWLLSSFRDTKSIVSDEDHEVIRCCGAYIGEVFISQHGWQWKYIPDRRFIFRQFAIVIGREGDELQYVAPECEVTALLSNRDKKRGFCERLLNPDKHATP